MPKSPVEMESACKVGFLALNEFTMISFASASEVLRMANYLSGKDYYSWSVITMDGAPVPSSNGLAVHPTTTYEEAGPFDMVFVCGGTNVERYVDDRVLALLRRMARNGVVLGGLCTGTYALVKSGLLDGYRCTIHWENMASLRESHRRVNFLEELFVIDRDRITCTGGIAPIDMMLALVKSRFGKTLVGEISDQFILERVRDSDDRQHIPLAARIGFNHRALVEVAALMEANFEEPLSAVELAKLTGHSLRQVQRMFQQSSRHHADQILPPAPPAPGPRASSSIPNVDHRNRRRLRLPIDVPFQQVLSRALRPYPPQRAPAAGRPGGAAASF